MQVKLNLLAAVAAGVTIGMLLSWAVHSRPDREMGRRLAAMQAEEVVYSLDAADRLLCEEQLGIRH